MIWILNLISSIIVLNLIHNIYVYVFKIEVVQRYLKRHSRWIELENIVFFRRFKIKEKIVHIAIVVYVSGAVSIFSFREMPLSAIEMNIPIIIILCILERYVNYNLRILKREVV